MKKTSASTPPAQTAPAGDNVDEEAGTGTAALAAANKEKVKPKLPASYKQRSTAIFKPLSSQEVATMLKEVAIIKQEYAKKERTAGFERKDVGVVTVPI